MRNTRNRRHLPLHLEPFEARQLLSASVAQTYTPLVTNSSPAVVASDQSDTGTTIQAATNQSFGGYLGTFHNLNIPNAPASAFYISNSILHIVNPAFPDTTDQTLDSYNVNINWGDGATVTHDAYLVPNPNGGYDLYASHVFSAAGSYQISASVQTTAIPNPQFTGSNPATGTVTSSGSFTTTAQVADNNPNAPQLLQLYAPSDTFSAKLSNFFGNDTTELLWGDGAGEGGYSSDSYVDPTAVDASHTYLSPGIYTVSALDRNSNTIFFAQMNATASSSPPPSPTPSLIFPAQSVAGQHFAGYLGTINNLPLPGQADLIFGGTSANTVVLSNTTQSTTLNISVNWGDGTTDNAVYLVSNGKGGYNVFGYHTYASAGEFAISVNVAGSPPPRPSTMAPSSQAPPPSAAAFPRPCTSPPPAPPPSHNSPPPTASSTAKSPPPSATAPPRSIGETVPPAPPPSSPPPAPTPPTPPSAPPPAPPPAPSSSPAPTPSTPTALTTTPPTAPTSSPSSPPRVPHRLLRRSHRHRPHLQPPRRPSHPPHTFADLSVTQRAPARRAPAPAPLAAPPRLRRSPPSPPPPHPKPPPSKQIQLTTGKRILRLPTATFTPQWQHSILLGVMTIHWGDGAPYPTAPPSARKKRHMDDSGQPPPTKRSATTPSQSPSGAIPRFPKKGNQRRSPASRLQPPAGPNAHSPSSLPRPWANAFNYGRR